MAFYRSKYYHHHLVRLGAVTLAMVIIYQTFLIQRFRTLLLDREQQYNQSKIGISAFAHYSPEGREYNSASHPFIFIGGHPRSGTTLLRAMLDSHPQVRCGEETRIIPRIMQLRDSIYASENEKARLSQGGVTNDVIDSAVTSFVLQSIVQHGPPAERLCNKDPLTLKYAEYFSRVFPRSKWIFIVRDGRAVVHSIIKRHITITGYEHDDPRACLEHWNSMVVIMDQVCSSVGSEKCLRIKYEELVLHPTHIMTSVLSFLSLPWNSSVLSHHTQINQPGGVRVSNMERSSDQIIQPVHTKALTEWVGTFPRRLLRQMDSVAPMLRKLGYNPYENPPRYGLADPEILNNTKQLARDDQFWQRKKEKMLREMEKPRLTEDLE